MIDWKPFETAPEGRDILIYQRRQDAHGVEGFYAENMVIGSFELIHGKVFVRPEAVTGFEWECEIEAPTHWAERPLPPA